MYGILMPEEKEMESFVRDSIQKKIGGAGVAGLVQAHDTAPKLSLLCAKQKLSGRTEHHNRHPLSWDQCCAEIWP
jgi:hypothetical protein